MAHCFKWPRPASSGPAWIPVAVNCVATNQTRIMPGEPRGPKNMARRALGHPGSVTGLDEGHWWTTCLPTRPKTTSDSSYKLSCVSIHIGGDTHTGGWFSFELACGDTQGKKKPRHYGRGSPVSFVEPSVTS